MTHDISWFYIMMECLMIRSKVISFHLYISISKGLKFLHDINVIFSSSNQNIHFIIYISKPKANNSLLASYVATLLDLDVEFKVELSFTLLP